MTGDVEEECSLLQISQLDGAIQPSSTAFVTSNMGAEDTCIYTATIPAELAGNFPQGSILRIMPDSAIVAVAVKNLPSSDFKESFENVESSLSLPNLLTESTHSIQQQALDVSVCPEENMDIDLSFLNDAENTMIPDPKCSNGNVAELQGITTDTSLQSLNLLQNNLPTNQTNSVEEQASSETINDSTDQSTGVVMIDVTKPIQLTQNSLIMVNGQKCILQHDNQTGQVLAYPVKEQEKPRRRRGRPRKASSEPALKETGQNESKTVTDIDYTSEEEREKGLQEIVNDDGALVRRSSRKRKKARILQDYETGNLRQELGSDIEDSENLDKDADSHKKKVRGPGRPRKYTVSETNANTGVRRQRGRPKKNSSENEPTQAFLVQTADGQALMMQVPLSSIPAGISLQQMAQEIADKLNLGLNQANNNPAPEAKESNPNNFKNESIPNSVELNVPEVALQDHSVGSTTNFPNVQSELDDSGENSLLEDGSCHDPTSGDIVCESEEVIFESENSAKDALSSSISINQNDLNSLQVPQCSDDHFSMHLPSTTVDSTSMYDNFDPLTDHDFCLPRSNVPEIIKNNIEEVETTEHSEMSELFDHNDVMKNKVNIKFLLQNKSNAYSHNISVQELQNKKSHSVNPSELILRVKDLSKTSLDDKHMKQTPNVKCFSEATNSVLDSLNKNAETVLEKSCLQFENDLENDACNNITESDFSVAVKPDLNIKSPQFIKPCLLNSENQTLQLFLSIENASSLLRSSDNISSTVPASNKVHPGQDVNAYFVGAKQCKICKMPYLKDEEIVEHFKTKHPKCICTECNYMNEHPYVIKRHALRHVNQGCVCKICNKKYKDMYILKMHIKMVHLPPDVLYACEICDKKFTRKAHLKRHLRIHAPIKQYQCPHCDYKGCEKSDITKHLLIHEEPKFKCEICGKAFRHMKNKELHLKRHSGQRDYKCAACGFFGYTYTDIRKHIERRHSVQTSCPQCKQVFSDAELLKEHQKNGSCHPALVDKNNEIKILESHSIAIVSKEATFSDEMPLDILDQPQVMAISECSEETLSALQNGQLVMTSVEGILNTQNGHLVIEGLEDNNIINAVNSSVTSIEKDSEKMIAVVTTDGKNLSLPLKNCSALPLDNVIASVDNSITEPYIISSETEVTS